MSAPPAGTELASLPGFLLEHNRGKGACTFVMVTVTFFAAPSTQPRPAWKSVGVVIEASCGCWYESDPISFPTGLMFGRDHYGLGLTLHTSLAV